MDALQPHEPDASDEQFETAIRETVAAVGGSLLFQMKLQEGENCRWAAAIAIEEDGRLEIVIVDLPCGTEGGNVSVSPVAESDLPIASLATAYASVAECWARAA